MGVQVDEAGRHVLADRVDDLGALGGVDPADLGDPAVLDPDVGLEPGRLDPVEDGSALDHDVVGAHGVGGGGGGGGGVG